VKIKRKLTATAPKKSFNKTEMENAQQELYTIKQQMKLMEKRESELKKRLDEYMQHALKPDRKGHYLFTVLNEKGERIHLQKQARRKVSLNEERAKAFLLENGFADAIVEKEVIAADVTQDQIIAELPAEYLDRAEVVDEAYLEQLISEEKITMDQFESICDINTTYAMTYIDDKRLQKDLEEEENATKGNGKGI
jgi:hypothetical protein